MAKKYGMRSAAGNKKVGSLVWRAKKAGKDWPAVEAELAELAGMQGFKEAAELAVLEAVKAEFAGPA